MSNYPFEAGEYLKNDPVPPVFTNPPRVINPLIGKTKCSVCKEFKEDANFHKNRAGKPMKMCRFCFGQRISKAWKKKQSTKKTVKTIEESSRVSHLVTILSEIKRIIDLPLPTQKRLDIIKELTK